MTTLTIMFIQKSLAIVIGLRSMSIVSHVKRCYSLANILNVTNSTSKKVYDITAFTVIVARRRHNKLPSGNMARE